MAGVLSTVGTSLTSSFARAAEAVKTEAYSIIANLISLLKTVVMYVYDWMSRFWSWFADNPVGGMTLLANFWVLAS
ncbi:MAG: hypothetical protein DRN17_07145 [Thermoplasmata archaeon]|nr:MAG: hypothetical protein DRN17_07145 [Thermoplasmata archaeon]